MSPNALHGSSYQASPPLPTLELIPELQQPGPEIEGIGVKAMEAVLLTLDQIAGHRETAVMTIPRSSPNPTYLILFFDQNFTFTPP